jgi:hypothetical protein
MTRLLDRLGLDGVGVVVSGSSGQVGLVVTRDSAPIDAGRPARSVQVLGPLSKVAPLALADLAPWPPKMGAGG